MYLYLFPNKLFRMQAAIILYVALIFILRILTKKIHSLGHFALNGLWFLLPPSEIPLSDADTSALNSRQRYDLNVLPSLSELSVPDRKRALKGQVKELKLTRVPVCFWLHFRC